MDYPYMYARVSAKRAKLLESSDYEQLLKMEPNEIARNLGEGVYQEQIDELGARHDGVELVELALNRNLSQELSHLVKISPPELQDVIETYLRRYDIMSLKRLLRWKKGGGKMPIEDLLTPIGRFDLAELKDLSGKDFDEIVRAIHFPRSDVNYQDLLEDRESISGIEQALDRGYYSELKILMDEVESVKFRQFIKEEMEYENLRTALRLKKYGLSREEIEEHMITGNGSDLVEKVINAEDLEAAMAAVKEDERGKDAERLEDIEHALEVERLENALQMLHTEPLGMTSILGYIVAKIIEVKNLRMLIRAKETGIQNLDTIRQNLVTA